MSFVMGDRAVQTSTTTGTGTFSLESPATGLRSFVTEIGTGNTTAYLAVDASGNWEIGTGVVTAGSPDTLSRINPPIKSSNSNNLVNFGAGSKTIACVPVASLIPYFPSPPSAQPGDFLTALSTGGWTPMRPKSALRNMMFNFEYTDIAAASTVNLANTNSFGVNITGTGVTITSFGSLTNFGQFRFVKFASAGNTLVNSANLKLRTGSDNTPEAGDVYIFVSDSLGLWSEVAFFPASVREGRIISHTFQYPGLVQAIDGTANKMLPMWVYVPAGYSARVLGYRAAIEDGTSVSVQLLRNGVTVTGWNATSVTPTPSTVTPTPLDLVSNDKLEFTHASPTGAPHNLSITMFVEYGRG